MSEINIYTKMALVGALVSNDIHYMHYLADGEDFDKSHALAEEYYDKLDEETDYLTELALEKKFPIINTSVAMQYVEDYEIESEEEYDYPTIVSHISNKLSIYVTNLQLLRDETDDADVQSKLDDMIRDWKKEIDYKLIRRLDETTQVDYDLDK